MLKIRCNRVSSKAHKSWYALLFLLCASFGLRAAPLSECSTLRVSGNPEYPPLLWPSVASPDLLDGAVPQFLRELAEPLGIKVSVRNIGSWARVQRLAELGEIDLVAGAFITAERLGYLDYILPPMMHLDTNVWVPRRSLGLGIARDAIVGVAVLHGGKVTCQSIKGGRPDRRVSLRPARLN